MVTKTPTTKAAPKAPRKPRVAAAKKKEVDAKAETSVTAAEAHVQAPAVKVQHKASSNKYIFATGRRKTAIANVRLFEGQSKHVVNKKPFEGYFPYSFHRDRALRPFDVTGLAKNYYFVANVNGGGSNAQAEAVSHGIARALSSISDEVRNVLKKNGLLTRDDRVKERKKPGLKRARRSPQWAKR